MTSVFDAQTMPLIERLGRFFQWHRKQLVTLIKADLLRVEAECQSQKDKLKFAAIQLKNEKTANELLNEKYQLILGKKIKLREEVKFNTCLLQNEKKANQQLAEELKNTNGLLENLHERHNCILERHDLVTRLLAAKPTINQGLAQYKELLYGDYITFANQESSLASEAEALLMMQAIENELELLVGFPEIYTKNVIAIGGGFSSGKSEFVNSFINDPEIQLAVGIQPVTAIPSYVVASPINRIRGNTTNGGRINLDVGAYSVMSHDFIKSFGFDLKLIMPFMSIGVALDSTLFSNICLIDTPGYDPASKDGYTEDDSQTAFNFIEQSNALIWVVGLDSNGTLPSSDLAFIRKLNMEGKKLFVVTNKADLRPQVDIEDILDEIDAVLVDEGLAYVGLSAYSSLKKMEFAFRKQSLFNFLKEQNNCVAIREHLHSRIDLVFDMYRRAIEEDISQRESVSLSFKSVQLDVLQNGDQKLYKKLEERFQSLRESFRVTELNDQLERIKVLNCNFHSAVKLLFIELENGIT